eukprot:768745-Hanusia_phi.AAC.7
MAIPAVISQWLDRARLQRPQGGAGLGDRWVLPENRDAQCVYPAGGGYGIVLSISAGRFVGDVV